MDNEEYKLASTLKKLESLEAKLDNLSNIVLENSYKSKFTEEQITEIKKNKENIRLNLEIINRDISNLHLGFNAIKWLTALVIGSILTAVIAAVSSTIKFMIK